MTYEDLWTSTNGMLAYFESFNDHKRVLRLRRLFYSLFGFRHRKSKILERESKNELYST